MSRFEKTQLNKLTPYRLSSHKAWSAGSKTLKLDWNESTKSLSDNVKQALVEEITNGNLNWYPNVDNNQLRRAIAQYSNVDDSNVQYFASSDALHEYIALAFVENSDRILIIGPTYDNFRAVVAAAGANAKFYNSSDESLQIDIAQLNIDLQLINPKVVYLVNPNNPTGHQYSKEAIESLLISHPNILFVIDEAYFEFSGFTCSIFVSLFDNLIVSRTFSKALGLASFRIGYCLAHENIISSLNKVRNAKNVSHLAQVAALSVLKDLDPINEYVSEVVEQRESFIEFLQQFSRYSPLPSSANFVFVKMNSPVNDLTSFLENKNIFIRDYSHLDITKDYVRFTIGNAQVMNSVKAAILEFEN